MQHSNSAGHSAWHVGCIYIYIYIYIYTKRDVFREDEREGERERDQAKTENIDRIREIRESEKQREREI